MRALSLRSIALSVVLTAFAADGGVARAQQQSYNPDGTPSMINPDGTFADGQGPGGVPSQPIAPLPQSEERFDVDCDPDIQNCTDPGDQAYDDGYDPNAYQQFQGALQPYGNWVQDPNYGQVWVPAPEVVGSDFEPYETSGQWVASNDYGFTWVSDFDWGWAPFHYGRWTCLDGYGWAWIPGTIWGPSWVNWRYGGGYVGWSPMGPRGVIVPPPRALGTRSAWRFALSTELFRRNPTLVPSAVAASVYARTAPVRNSRLVGYGAVNARIALGPPIATLSRDLGRTIPALGLRNTAPSVLPRANVVARAGVTVSQRPYMRSGAPTMIIPARMPARSTIPAPSPYRYGNAATSQPAYRPVSPAYSHPGYRAPQQAYGPTQTYHPAYSAPAQTYHPAYSAPAQTYHPAYSAPSYSAPSYSAPAQTYHAAPAPAPAPAATHYSAPSFSGGGGHRHR